MKAIDELKQKKNVAWVNFLTKTRETNINYEHLESVKTISNKLTYKYILRCFEILEENRTTMDDKTYDYICETLKWSDVAKVGSKEYRTQWLNKGYDLFVHNIGSSQIYVEENKNYDEIVRVLIKTHGLIGQYIRGEVNLDKNKELYELIEKKLITKEELKKVLIGLNKCVIGAVSLPLYDKVKNEVLACIDLIVNNEFSLKVDIKDKIKRLNKNTTTNDLKILDNEKIKTALTKVFNNLELWYYESALGEFNLLEQVKILLIIANHIDTTTNQVTFENVMKTIYLDYNGKKKINIYKKRIIEKMLDEISIDSIINNNIKSNPHIECKITKMGETLIFDFVFSIQTTKLIEFCEVAYTTNSIYNKAVYMLYDLLGFRRDEYDRFYNEIDYLAIMNSSISNKKVLLNYLVGENILDVGPGGGVLMDLIEESDSKYKVFGIDISSNVIDELNKKKISENRKWTLIKGDALNLENYFKKSSIDTIIYSSIIHELYSYIDYNGKKFNIETVIKTLVAAYNIIPVGGRILIRDGIKTEPQNDYRIIEFRNIDDINILKTYCNDFKGRKITYEVLENKRVKMLVNDAMEFLYTYTWGENSYSLEVKEQFGYLTPTEYQDLIKKYLPNSIIVECMAFLQDGYKENLLNKITIYDDEMNIVKLPNSTCIIVIEKGK